MLTFSCKSIGIIIKLLVLVSKKSKRYTALILVLTASCTNISQYNFLGYQQIQCIV